MEFLKINQAYDTHIALIQLDRPKEMNALNLQLMGELRDSLKELDKNDEVRVIIITGNEKAFAAGADIKQMADKSTIEMWQIDQFSTWDQIRKTKKPLIAAVSGFALGGGCELAMTCDMNSTLCNSSEGHIHMIRHELSQNNTHLKTTYTTFKDGKYKKDSIYHFDRKF